MEPIRNYQQSQEQYQSIKPAVKNSLLLLQNLILALFLSAFAIAFLIPLFVFVSTVFNSTGIFINFVIAFLIFFIIWFGLFLLSRASLKRTEYKFYSDRVEYYEGFLVKSRKTINYNRITNVGQRQGIIEGWFGLGTIFIDTAGSSPTGHELAMSYLENPNQIYDWITKITLQRH